MTLIDLPPSGPEFATIHNPEYRAILQRNVELYRQEHPEDVRPRADILLMIDMQASQVLAEIPASVQAGAGLLAVGSEYQPAS